MAASEQMHQADKHSVQTLVADHMLCCHDHWSRLQCVWQDPQSMEHQADSWWIIWRYCSCFGSWSGDNRFLFVNNSELPGQTKPLLCKFHVALAQQTSSLAACSCVAIIASSVRRRWKRTCDRCAPLLTFAPNFAIFCTTLIACIVVTAVCFVVPICFGTGTCSQGATHKLEVCVNLHSGWQLVKAEPKQPICTRA